ncbi:MAG: cupin domain-containing protein [Cyanobacteria bacterium P01_D01_bin.44]
MTYPEQPLTPDDTLADEQALAAIQALGALNGNRDDHAEMPTSVTFAQQVSNYESTLAAIPYSIPSVPIAADLKSRLFQRIAGESAHLEVGPHSAKLIELLKYSVEELKRQAATLAWAPMAGANAELAIWQIDDLHREVAFFVRAAVGGTFPNHAHASGETVLVLDGDFVVEGNVYSVGDRISALGSTAHQPETQEGCLLFCISSIDDEILG